MSFIELVSSLERKRAFSCKTEAIFNAIRWLFVQRRRKKGRGKIGSKTGVGVFEVIIKGLSVGREGEVNDERRRRCAFNA